MQYGYQQQPGYAHPQQNVVYVKDKKKGGGMLSSNTGKMAAGMYFLIHSIYKMLGSNTGKMAAGMYVFVYSR